MSFSASAEESAAANDVDTGSVLSATEDADLNVTSTPAATMDLCTDQRKGKRPLFVTT
jgi:hypothetical protein